jgi:hypothetical protein
MDVASLEDIYELTWYQAKALLSAERGEGVFHEQLAFVLLGHIDVDVFRQVWETIVERHTILRTSFHHEGLQKPLQTVHREVELPFELQDWTHIDPAEHDAKFQNCLKEDRLLGFDVTVAPPMRITLVKCSPEKYIFWWRFHHILMDGWSFAIVLDEWLKLYRAYYLKEEPREMPPYYPFKEYVVWRKNRDISREQAFWRKEMAGFVPPKPLDLGPAELSNRKVADRTAARQNRTDHNLTAEDSAAIWDVVKKEEVTLNGVYQAIWRLMLSRFSGEKDIITGAAVADRPQIMKDSFYRVGLYINPIPVRYSIDPEMRFVDYVKKLQSHMADVFDHCSSSEDEIRDWCGIVSDNPIFECIVIYENMPLPNYNFENLDFALGDVFLESRPQFPINFLVFPDPEIKMKIIYDACRFNIDAAASLLQKIHEGLMAFVANPKALVKEIP